MNLKKINDDTMIVKYQNTDNVLEDVCTIINSARDYTYKAVNVALVQRNWLIGYRIAEEELKGNNRADYGVEIIKKLSKELKKKYGKGFDRSNLYRFLNFYKTFPQIVDAVCRQSEILLSWSHYRTLLQVLDNEARDWYEREAAKETWCVRTLQRNIDTQYYYRLLKSQAKEPVIQEMKEKTKDNDLLYRLEFIKNPIIAEFLGYSLEKSFTETDLETSIINNLQKFLIELGKGDAFVARQQHIHTEKEDYYIDLVFYNRLLKCFVLIDLKIGKVSHQDIGQMQMYVNYYDREIRNKEENLTIGILLSTDKNETLVKYTLPEDNKTIFSSEYKLHMPTEQELRAEIENQKMIFDLQHENIKDEVVK